MEIRLGNHFDIGQIDECRRLLIFHPVARSGNVWHTPEVVVCINPDEKRVTYKINYSGERKLDDISETIIIAGIMQQIPEITGIDLEGFKYDRL